MKKTKAAVFASGTGSNFQAIMEDDDLPIEVALLVCDKPGATVIKKAEQYDVPVLDFEPSAYASKAIYEQKLIEELEKAGVEWIFLAGDRKSVV